MTDRQTREQMLMNLRTPASGEAGEMETRLRDMIHTAWCENRDNDALFYEDILERLSTDTEAMRQIAADLIDQRDEPDMFGLSYDRVHYWRDKAIKAAARIDALANGGAS